MRYKERGSALLTVLWLTAALSAIGLAVAANVRGETERAATNVDDAKSWFIARGAVERAALHMLWGRLYTTPDGQPLYYRFGAPAMDLAFPTADVHVEIIPETSKLDLNSVRPEELLRLLVALGVPEDPATEIAAAIADWHAPLNPLRPSPFDSFYEEQSPSFLPPHTSFQENEELLLVRGITPELYYGASINADHAGLRDCLSVFGSNSGLDVNTVRPETMAAIGIDPEEAAEIAKSRAEHPILDYRGLAAIQQSLGPAGFRLRLGGVSMYTLRATARLRLQDGKLSDLRRTVAALVKFNYPGNKLGKQPGFEIVRWYDRV
jgi:general secretion pathway protein K